MLGIVKMADNCSVLTFIKNYVPHWFRFLGCVGRYFKTNIVGWMKLHYSFLLDAETLAVTT